MEELESSEEFLVSRILFGYNILVPEACVMFLWGRAVLGGLFGTDMVSDNRCPIDSWSFDEVKMSQRFFGG